jgi:hypothetical protein
MALKRLESQEEILSNSKSGNHHPLSKRKPMEISLKFDMNLRKFRQFSHSIDSN